MGLSCGVSPRHSTSIAALVQGSSGMAKAPTTSKDLDSDVAKELEKALDRDLVSEGDDLDIAASMEDLEAQISRAAEELSRETHNAQAKQEAPAARAPQDGEFLIEADVKPASSLGLRPADPPAYRSRRQMTTPSANPAWCCRT